MKKIEYKVFRTAHKGMKYENDLPESVVRKNADGSLEVVGKFHSPVYAQQLAKILNEQVDKI
jgi:hypothetical protein